VVSPHTKPKTKADEIFEKINSMVGTGSANEFELKKFKIEAEKLKEIDIAAAFTILGMIACVEGDIEEMHSCHKSAIAYSDENWVKSQYSISLLNRYLFQEAYIIAKEIYDNDPTLLKNLDTLIKATNSLDLEKEFQKYVAEWKKNTGENHSLISFSEDNDDELDKILEHFDDVIDRSPDLIVKPDPILIDLADELVEGVDIN